MIANTNGMNLKQLMIQLEILATFVKIPVIKTNHEMIPKEIKTT